MGLVYELTDLQGRVLTEYEDRTDPEVAIGRNARRSAKCFVSLEDEDVGLAAAMTTRLRVYLDGAIVFNGTVGTAKPIYHEGRLELGAEDPSRQLEQAFVKVPGSPPRWAAINPATSWASFDQGWIIQRLVAHADASAGEKAYGMPGHGIVNGSIPLTKNRARNYEPGKQIWEAIVEMTNVIGGPDVELEPVVGEDGTVCRLNVYASQGADRSLDVVFQYGTGDHNCVEFTEDADGFATRTRFTSVGQAETVGDVEVAPPVYSTTSMEAFRVGIWEGFEGRPDVSEAPTLQQHAQGEIAKYAVPPKYVDLTPAPQGAEGYGQPPKFGPRPTAVGQPGPDFYIGDRVFAEARRGKKQTAGVFRVEQATLKDADQAGTVQVDLTLAPLVLAAD